MSVFVKCKLTQEARPEIPQTLNQKVWMKKVFLIFNSNTNKMWDLGAMKNAHKRVRYTRLWYQLQQARNFSAWWIYSITKYKLPFHWGKKLSGSSLSYLPTSRPDSLLRISKTSSDVDVLCKEGLAKKKGVPWLDPAVQGHLHRTQRNFPASVEQRQSYLANHSWTRTQWCMRYNQWLEKSAPKGKRKELKSLSYDVTAT